MVNCSLCKSKSQHMRETLYGDYICGKCHNLIRRRDVKQDLEDLDKAMHEFENSIKSYANLKFSRGHTLTDPDEEVYTAFPVSAFKPYSETERSIQQNSFGMRFLAYWCPSLYRQCLGEDVKRRINKELKESAENHKRMLREEYAKQERQRAIHIENSINQKRQEAYPERYCAIIKIAKQKNIRLYEYYLDEYPPDWRQRSKKVKMRDNNKCQECSSTKKLHVHHINEVFRSNRYGPDFDQVRKRQQSNLYKGDHYLDNLITLCNDCHLKEHDLKEWSWNKKHIV